MADDFYLFPLDLSSLGQLLNLVTFFQKQFIFFACFFFLHSEL